MSDPELARELWETVAELDAQIAEFRASFASLPSYPPGTSVYAARDVNGRPILGDLFAAKANALAALSRLENHA